MCSGPDLDCPRSQIASTVACGLLNVLIERIAYRRLRNAPRLAPLISAIGVSFILVNIGLVWKGASQVNFPNLLPPTYADPQRSGLTFTVKSGADNVLKVELVSE